MDTPISTTQEQGVTQKIILIDQGRTEEETPKEKEQETIQSLVNLPTSRTPIGMPQS